MNVTLLVVQGRPSGKKLIFPRGEYYFGRGAECHVRPDSEWVSRQHCLLRVTADGAWVQDLGSRNGTLVNGELVSGERRLWPGDHLQIGPLVFEVSLGPSQTPPPRAAGQTTTAVARDESTVEAGPGGTGNTAAEEPTTDSTDHHPVLPPEKAPERE